MFKIIEGTTSAKMVSYLRFKSKVDQLSTAFFLAIVLANNLNAELINQHNKTELEFDPFHLSWTSRNTRYDFVFSFNGTIRNLVKLESDPGNFLTNSLKNCTNHSACLFRNGTHLESFQVDNTKKHESVFKSVDEIKTKTVQTASSAKECDIANILKINHYCSTHWNPPVYLHRTGCFHLIEWHSPITCDSSSTNHEKPCYIYEPSGKLIDLTPWILSNGSSYEIDVGNNTDIKRFDLNVCNEAQDRCGPNVAACFLDHSGMVESGYNNLTSIKYEMSDQSVLLTTFGHYNEHCDNSRMKTVTRFICKNQIMTNTRPRLIRSTACEQIIEWPSIHACPLTDVSVPETECSIKYKPLGIDIDIKKLTNNQTKIEIPVKLDGQDKTMIFGICQAIPKTYKCEGKLNSNTKACLIDAHDNSTVRSVNNSMIVGVFTKSFIRLADDRIYLESFAVNRTCSESVRGNFNVTQQVGTRIEFFCSERAQDKPSFLGYDDCTYVFEWGSPSLCLEAFSISTKRPSATTVGNETYVKDVINSGSQNPNKKETFKQDDKPRPYKPRGQTAAVEPPKMNSVHKFFMITLIIVSLAAFIVVIFVLDNKTRLRVKLRQARQVFQSNNQQPYSRVIDHLDL